MTPKIHIRFLKYLILKPHEGGEKYKIRDDIHFAENKILIQISGIEQYFK